MGHFVFTNTFILVYIYIYVLYLSLLCICRYSYTYIHIRLDLQVTTRLALVMKLWLIATNPAGNKTNVVGATGLDVMMNASSYFPSSRPDIFYG